MTTPADQSGEDGYELVYPFVVCKTQGGPFDDAAFVSGCNFGELSNRAQRREPVIEQYVHPALVPQIELLAMHEGYTLTTEPWDEHPDEYAHVSLALNGELNA